MKKLILVLSILTTQQSFAAGAASYLCEGVNKVTGKTVSYEVLFSDHGHDVGYTNQSITVTKEDNSTVTFQMYGATRKNHCKKNEFGEVFLASGFNMGETMDFKITCGKELNFNVQGTCVLN